MGNYWLDKFFADELVEFFRLITNAVDYRVAKGRHYHLTATTKDYPTFTMMTVDIDGNAIGSLEVPPKWVAEVLNTLRERFGQ